MGTKQCSICHATLPLDAFYACHGKPRSECKVCFNSRRSDRNPGGRKKRIKDGDQIPNSSGEMYELLIAECFNIPPEDADHLKRQWVANDLAVHENLADLLSLNDQLPPCHTCPSAVLFFCYTTGRECKNFASWSAEGTRRLTMVQEEESNTKTVNRCGTPSRQVRLAAKQ